MYNEIRFSYYLNHNYGKLAVSSTFAQESVGVINQQGNLQHVVFDGEVALDKAIVIEQNQVGYLTAFFGSPGYRKSDINGSWDFVSSPDFLACMVIQNKCYTVLKDLAPYVCKPEDEDYLVIKRNVDNYQRYADRPSSVVSMADFKRNR